jgi:hypothetical protein
VDCQEVLQIIEPLPTPTSRRCISVHADVDGITFLERVKELLPEVADWQFYDWEIDHFSSVAGGKCLVLIYTGSEPAGQRARGLVCRLLANKQTNKVDLHIRATASWLGNKLDYDAYVAAAKLFKSALGIYNRKHGTRRRLRIPRKQSLEPQLPPGAQKLFGRFLAQASNRQVVSEYAWGRLYAFIKHTHSHNIRLSDSEFRRLLVLEGFDENQARKLADFYLHARNLLYLVRGYGTAAVWPHLCWRAWL